jgi:hypothetical protein
MSMFGANIYLLIGLLLALGAAFIILIAGWTSIRIALWKWAKRQSDAEISREKTQADGQPYPPSSRGICQKCGRQFNKVYHLPTGERLCPTDYDAHRPRQNA